MSFASPAPVAAPGSADIIIPDYTAPAGGAPAAATSMGSSGEDEWAKRDAQGLQPLKADGPRETEAEMVSKVRLLQPGSGIAGLPARRCVLPWPCFANGGPSAFHSHLQSQRRLTQTCRLA